MSLSWLVIRVLSDNHHLHLVERTEIEGIEDEMPRRIACGTTVFLMYEIDKTDEILLVELVAKLLAPRLFYLYIRVFLECFLFL